MYVCPLNKNAMAQYKKRTLNDKIREADESNVNLSLEVFCGSIIAAGLLILLKIYLTNTWE